VLRVKSGKAGTKLPYIAPQIVLGYTLSPSLPTLRGLRKPPAQAPSLRRGFSFCKVEPHPLVPAVLGEHASTTKMGEVFMPVFQESAPYALDTSVLLTALSALKKGDFTVRLPMDWTGLAGKVADAFNDVVELNQRMARELDRLSRVVGKEG